jgi:murein DD-endopeptidase MepM/ murein hydrolase activator NlpD
LAIPSPRASRLQTMRPLPLVTLVVLVAACAPPVSRPGTAPVPAPEPVAPALIQSGGPDGESPAPRAIPLSTAAVPAGVKDLDRARDMTRLRDHHLLIPVAGVGPERLQDSFTDARDGGRQHNAIDILAPRNTPILAADDGVILRMSSNVLGGITIFAADVDRQFVYYYAHLDHYDPAMYAGRKLAKGETIGYVGTTGDAPKNVPHLHFQIMRWPEDGKYWVGEPINPYPLLHVGVAERR